MQFRSLWLLFLLGVGSAEAGEYPEDGAALLGHCLQAELIGNTDASTPQSAKEDAWFCIAYVEGFSSAIQTNYNFLKSAKIDNFRPICIPAGTDNGRLVRVVVRHLQDNPEQQKKPKFVGTYLALLEAFPCDPKEEASASLPQ